MPEHHPETRAPSKPSSFSGGPRIADREALTRRPEGRAKVMFQRWSNLLFLHWAVPPETIQATLPPGLHVDTWDRRGWLGVVPFFMEGLRPRFCPPVHGISNFLELNLRTYVHDEAGRPGVWFYSLDANQRLGVRIAQTVFSLPYVYADIQAGSGPDRWIDFQSERKGQPRQHFRYRSGAGLGTAEPGSLEFFLVERYLLFAHRQKSGSLFAGRIHHAPYPLAQPEVSAWSTDLFRLNGFADPGRCFDHALMSPGVSVTVYGLERVR